MAADNFFDILDPAQASEAAAMRRQALQRQQMQDEMARAQMSPTANANFLAMGAGRQIAEAQNGPQPVKVDATMARAQRFQTIAGSVKASVGTDDPEKYLTALESALNNEGFVSEGMKVGKARNDFMEAQAKKAQAAKTHLDPNGIGTVILKAIFDSKIDATSGQAALDQIAAGQKPKMSDLKFIPKDAVPDGPAYDTKIGDKIVRMQVWKTPTGEKFEKVVAGDNINVKQEANPTINAGKELKEGVATRERVVSELKPLDADIRNLMQAQSAMRHAIETGNGASYKAALQQWQGAVAAAGGRTGLGESRDINNDGSIFESIGNDISKGLTGTPMIQTMLKKLQATDKYIEGVRNQRRGTLEEIQKFGQSIDGLTEAQLEVVLPKDPVDARKAGKPGALKPTMGADGVLRFNR